MPVRLIDLLCWPICAITHSSILQQISMQIEKYSLTVFLTEFDRVVQQSSEPEKVLLRKCLVPGSGPKPNLARQLLKSINKALQTSEQSPLKELLRIKMSLPMLEEYVFGSLEAKAFELNILKKISIDLKHVASFATRIKGFEANKRTIEILELLRHHHPDPPSDQINALSPLIDSIFHQIAAYLEEATRSIVDNHFRTKWLQYFVDLVRCVNSIIRFVGDPPHNQFQQKITIIHQNVSKCIEHAHVLTKEVITQLYLAAVYLDPALQQPTDPLRTIHFLHAHAIINNRNTIPQLLKLLMSIKDTENKSQLAPILLKSFQLNYKIGELTDELKNDAFDVIITLFEVGRSVYNYLQEIVDIIIVSGGNWNLEGNFIRKFFIARVALKHVPPADIISQWPTVINDCISECGTMTLPYVCDCLEILLTKLYEECGRNYQQWMQKWIGIYKQALRSDNKAILRGLTEAVNPIILKIDNRPNLLKQLLTWLNQMSKQQQMPKQQLGGSSGSSSLELCLISVLKCFRQLGKIVSSTCQIENEQQSFSHKYQISQQAFVHVDDPLNIHLSHRYLLSLLLSNDPVISCQTLEFLTSSRKPSTLILPPQMHIIIQFYSSCLKTSLPEYRKNYLNLTKRLLERFRRIYDKDITQQTKPLSKPTRYFSEFIEFINQLIDLCYYNIYPDSIFQITNPALEILNLLLNLYGQANMQIRKGVFVRPSHFLECHTGFFKVGNFYNLVSCLQSSYESIRSLAHRILNSFRIDKFSRKDQENLRVVWCNSLRNTNKLSIRGYEFACRMLIYISTSCINSGSCYQKQGSAQQQGGNGFKMMEGLPDTYAIPQLNIGYFLLQILRKRYVIFKQQFIQQSQQYYENLLHGILTCFSYLLDDDSIFNAATSQTAQSQLRTFLADFFTQITQILDFAVEISSESVSTVVLDTLSHGSQTDQKLRVDCRGHFLPNTTNRVGQYLNSTALITSMQNEQQGIENTLVVSFYLLTREAGLVFQTIGSQLTRMNSTLTLPKPQLIKLINTYFYALINLKHMGSVDRISTGLSKIAKTMFDHEDPDLNQIPEGLLEELLKNLSGGKFTNILRRSAGVPYAFCCLLKSETLKRKQLIKKTINCLLQLTVESPNTESQMRIHSLNILKKLFQDSDLKQDLDAFVSEALMNSINGFTSEEWGVRNSSLMLFTTLVNRTVGIKPTYNLLEFFHKCPQLFEFLSTQLSCPKTMTMYPPLYPISLLLSRLLPFDLKQQTRMAVKGSKSAIKVRKQELLSLLPKLRSAGDNPNFMGRVMTAKAILPFMEVTNIIPHCLQLLDQFFTNYSCQQISNNCEHYRLTECYHLIVSYFRILQNNKQLQQLVHPHLTIRIHSLMATNIQYLYSQDDGVVCPAVREILLKIYIQLTQKYVLVEQSPSQTQLLTDMAHAVEPVVQTIIKREHLLINNQSAPADLGHSLMYISAIELLHLCYTDPKPDSQSNPCPQYCVYVDHLAKSLPTLSKRQHKSSEVDNRIRCLIISKINQLLARGPQLFVVLNSKVMTWLHQLDFESLSDDYIKIEVLNLLSSLQARLQRSLLGCQSNHIVEYLTDLQKKSENKHLKSTIFKYLQNSHSYLQTQQSIDQLLNQYSQPEQLEQLRQVCVEYLQEVPQALNFALLPVYLRLLEDEEQQIRKRSSAALCRIMTIPNTNEQALANQLLLHFTNTEADTSKLTDFFASIIKNSSDYEIRMKNHNQSRIFSYDKPNKYRTDTNTIVQLCKLIPPQIINSVMQDSSVSKPNSQQFLQLIDKYSDSIMERDEYEFESLIRGLMTYSDFQSQRLSKMKGFHPIFQDVYNLMHPMDQQ